MRLEKTINIYGDKSTQNYCLIIAFKDEETHNSVGKYSEYDRFNNLRYEDYGTNEVAFVKKQYDKSNNSLMYYL